MVESTTAPTSRLPSMNPHIHTQIHRLAPADAGAGDDAPVAVLGARGKTGRLIVKDLLAMGKRVRAVSYQPFAFEDKARARVFVCLCDSGRVCMYMKHKTSHPQPAAPNPLTPNPESPRTHNAHTGRGRRHGRGEGTAGLRGWGRDQARDASGGD